LHLLDFVFQPGDAVANQPAIGFDRVSPGPPMKPKPPRCRSRWVQDRTSRLRW